MESFKGKIKVFLAGVLLTLGVMANVEASVLVRRAADAASKFSRSYHMPDLPEGAFGFASKMPSGPSVTQSLPKMPSGPSVTQSLPMKSVPPINSGVPINRRATVELPERAMVQDSVPHSAQRDLGEALYKVNQHLRSGPRGSGRNLNVEGQVMATTPVPHKALPVSQNIERQQVKEFPMSGSGSPNAFELPSPQLAVQPVAAAPLLAPKTTGIGLAGLREGVQGVRARAGNLYNRLPSVPWFSRLTGEQRLAALLGVGSAGAIGLDALAQQQDMSGSEQPYVYYSNDLDYYGLGGTNQPDPTSQREKDKREQRLRKINESLWQQRHIYVDQYDRLDKEIRDLEKNKNGYLAGRISNREAVLDADKALADIERTIQNLKKERDNVGFKINAKLEEIRRNYKKYRQRLPLL